MSTEFTAQQFRWLRQINHDPELEPVDVCVALQLTQNFNEDDQDGRAFPSYQHISDKIKVPKPTVIRSIERLHERGHLRIEWGSAGRGRPNQYWMIEKRSTDGPISSEKRSTSGPIKSKKRSTAKNEKVHLDHGKGPRVDLNLKENLKENRGSAPAPDFSDGSEEKAHAASVGKVEVAAAFGRFWSVFPPRLGKLVGKVGAEKAFAAALKAGIPAEVIIDGASAYARRRAAEIAEGDEERWTKEPTNWLREGKWDEAASGDGSPLLDERGDVVTGNGHDESRMTWEEWRRL
jgi:hypothetical protein